MIGIKTNLFRFYIGWRNDLGARPFGFWFMWKPKPWLAKTRYETISCAWFYGMVYSRLSGWVADHKLKNLDHLAFLFCYYGWLK